MSAPRSARPSSRAPTARSLAARKAAAREDKPPAAAPLVAVVAFDRISPFHLSVPCVVFGEDHPGAPPYRLAVCALESGPLRTSAGFDIHATRGLRALAQADIVIMPSWRDPSEPIPAALLRALRAAHARGACVVGLCLGAYALAAAGLLDGRRASTHWAYAEDFAARFPAVRVDAGVLYVEEDDGRLLTSAGTAAGIDCCLHLLRRRHGAEAANRVARRLVMPAQRSGGQAQFVEIPLPQTRGDARLSELLDWMRAHPAQAHTLESLAARVAMSRRSFTRRFRQLTGRSALDWLLEQRLAYAQRLLETGERSIETVATLAGFGSAALLRRHFQARFGTSPRAWRAMFSPNAAEPPKSAAPLDRAG